MVKRALAKSAPDADELTTTFDHTAREYEVDSQQHINNCAYADWLWEAAHQALGQGHQYGLASFRPRYYAIEYVKPTLPGERIRVATRLKPPVGNRLQIKQEIVHAASSSVCVRANTTYLRPRT
jgi:acyl-CoA thioesterase FadM